MSGIEIDIGGIDLALPGIAPPFAQAVAEGLGAALSARLAARFAAQTGVLPAVLNLDHLALDALDLPPVGVLRSQEWIDLLAERLAARLTETIWRE